MRTFERVSVCCCLMLAFTLSYQPALGQQITSVNVDTMVFTKENADRLCGTEKGRQVIKRERLAYALIWASGSLKTVDDFETYLRLATPDGTAVRRYKEENVIHFVSSSSPFGANKELTDEQRMVAARQMLAYLSFWQWLRGQHKDNENYELSGTGPPPDPARYFLKEDYQIVCKNKRAGKKKDEVADWTKPIIVRKSASEINAQGNDLKKTSGAQFSFSDDREKGKASGAIEGLIGYVVAGTGADRVEELANKQRVKAVETEPRPLSWYKVVPYLYYKNSTQRPAGNKDIEYVSPGVSATYTWVNTPGTFAYDLQFDANYTRDTQFDSRFYSMGIRFSPSFYDGKTFIFGAPLSLGSLVMRPDIALVARQFVIDEPGTNPDLALVSTYTGLGSDVSAQFWLDSSDPLLSKLVWKANYAYRHNTGVTPDISRVTVGVSYELGKHTTIDLDFTRGRDLNILQEEDKWMAALTFRN